MRPEKGRARGAGGRGRDRGRRALEEISAGAWDRKVTPRTGSGG